MGGVGSGRGGGLAGAAGLGTGGGMIDDLRSVESDPGLIALPVLLLFNDSVCQPRKVFRFREMEFLVERRSVLHDRDAFDLSDVVKDSRYCLEFGNRRQVCDEECRLDEPEAKDWDACHLRDLLEDG